MGLFGSSKTEKDKTDPVSASTRKRKDNRSLLKRSKTLLTFASICAIAAGLGVFIVISQLLSQTSYYVLNQNVPARTLIEDSMLTEVRTTNGAQPRNSLDVGDVQSGEVYSKYALETGDVLSPSNAGALTRINEGIPEDFVVMSFTVPAEQAVAGNVKRGDYIDIIGTTGTAVDSSSLARYSLRHVLVLDVLATPRALNQGEGEQAAAEGGEGTGVANLYTVALSEKDASTLALLNGTSYHIVLSPAEGADSPEDIRSTGDDVFGNEPVDDSGAGTSPSFDGEPAPSSEAVTPENGGEQGEAPAPEQPENPVPEVPVVPEG